jgi:hypothetical protein
MLLKDALIKITRLLNIEYDGFEERAKIYFMMAQSDLVSSGNYSDEEMLPLMNTVTKSINLNFGEAEVLFVNDIITRVVEAKINNEPGRNHVLRVVDEELFRYLETLPRAKRNVYNNNMVYLSKTKNIFKVFGNTRTPVNITIQYISIPQDMPMTQDLSLYSGKLIKDIIRLASDKFLHEQSR